MCLNQIALLLLGPFLDHHSVRMTVFAVRVHLFVLNYLLLDFVQIAYKMKTENSYECIHYVWITKNRGHLKKTVEQFL